MKQIFFRNLIFLVILNLLIKPLYVLGVDRTVQNLTGHAEYGLYFALFNLSFLFNIILDIGITSYNNRIIAQQPSLIKKYLSNILMLKLLLFLFYVLITLIAAIYLKPNAHGFFILGILCVNQGLNSLILYLRSNLSALHYFKLDSFTSVFDKLLMILIFGWIYYFHPFAGDFKIEWFVFSQTVSSLLTVLIVILFLLKRIPVPQFQFDKKLLGKIWKESYLLALVVLMMSIYSRTDGVLLKKLLGETGDREAGIYATAFRLLDAANQFGFLFATLLLPIFSRLIARGQKVDDLVAVSFKTIFIFSWTVAAIALCFRNEIMQLLYNEASVYSANTLGILMFSLPGAATVFIFGTLLSANRSLIQLVLATSAAAVLNLVLNFILIPKYQCIGAAISAVSTQLLVCGTEILISRKIFQFKMNYTLLTQLFLFSVLSIFINYCCHEFISSFIPALLVGLIATLLLAFVLRLFEVKKVMLLFSKSDE